MVHVCKHFCIFQLHLDNRQDFVLFKIVFFDAGVTHILIFLIKIHGNLCKFRKMWKLHSYSVFSIQYYSNIIFFKYYGVIDILILAIHILMIQIYANFCSLYVKYGSCITAAINFVLKIYTQKICEKAIFLSKFLQLTNIKCMKTLRY